jgi:hypothetical protein
MIRRMRCITCCRIHHELPDILVPYKRYSAECIESVLDKNSDLPIAADDSTIWQWLQWFGDKKDYLAGSLLSILHPYEPGIAEDLSTLPAAPLPRIKYLVGATPGWLARVVRTVANCNLWPQTRFAFLS